MPDLRHAIAAEAVDRKVSAKVFTDLTDQLRKTIVHDSLKQESAEWLESVIVALVSWGVDSRIAEGTSIFSATEPRRLRKGAVLQLVEGIASTPPSIRARWAEVFRPLLTELQRL